MNTLASFFMSMAGPLAMRVLIALGVGTITFTGVTAALQGLITQAQTNWSSVGAAVLQLASLGGVPDGLGIIAGAMTTRVAIWAAASATKFLVGAPS